MSDTIHVIETRYLPSHLWHTVRLICKHSCHVDGHALGFLPLSAYDHRHERGDLIAIYRNDDLVGYAMIGVNTSRECRILQIWVRPDARQITHGRALIHYIAKKKAEPTHCWLLRLWCADDLPANIFWRALGFEYRGWRWGRKLKRKHLLWTIDLRHAAALTLGQRTTPSQLAHDAPNRRPLLLPS